jgi:hypothetical protein
MIRQVNLVDNTMFDGEAEYLFVPYSVFTVECVDMEDTGAAVITLQAALDNTQEREDLPLATWY